MLRPRRSCVFPSFLPPPTSSSTRSSMRSSAFNARRRVPSHRSSSTRTAGTWKGRGRAS